MKLALVLVALLGFGLAFLAWRNAHVAVDRSSGRVQIMTPGSIRVHEIAAVVEQLETNRKEGSWAAFAFTPPGEVATDESSVNLQYSFEGGKIGLDWVLLGTRNKADREKVAEFVRRQNHTVLEREGNGVRYLRVEDGDLAITRHDNTGAFVSHEQR